MTKEKQIEEMANTYYEAMLKARGTLGSMNEGAPKWYAKHFYDAGYRKASDIFEEIEESLHNLAQLYLNCDLKDNFGICYSIYEEAVLPIKKKYTESENDNG